MYGKYWEKEVEMRINDYLIKLIEIIKEMEEVDFFVGNTKLTTTEFRLLREILIEEERGEKIISSELARRLGITRSAISQLVSKLEERNIVERVASATDKKIAYVCFTDYALRLFDEQCKVSNEIMNRVVQKMGEEKLDALIAGYNEFAMALSDARKEVEEA